MIVCHCYRVSDRQIRSCAGSGAQSVADVGRACGAGTGCGGCRPEIAQIVESEVDATDAGARHALPILQATG